MPAAKVAGGKAPAAAATVEPAHRRLSLGKAFAEKTVDEFKASTADVQTLRSLKGTISSHTGKDSTPLVLRTVTDSLLQRKRAFEEKDLEAEGGEVAMLLRSLASAGIGLSCRKGMKAEAPNQDCYTVVIQDSAFKLFAVFDGHGPKGHDISGFTAENLVKLFLRNPARTTSPETALREAFVDTQAIIDELTRTGQISGGDSGTTGTVAYMPAGASLLHMAHVGDSRAVICRQGPTDKSCVAMDLTVDHKPDLKEERERIEKAGGHVVFDGYFNYRVYSSDGRGGLNMSRSLGDGFAQKAGVSAIPENNQLEIDVAKAKTAEGQDLFMMLCSDGVWEFIQSQAACDMVMRHGRQNVKKATEELAKASYDAWMQDSDGEVSDDITIIVVWF